MYSNIAQAECSYQDMTVRELRDRLYKENNLTVFDVYKGYHEKSVLPVNLHITLNDRQQVLYDEFAKKLKAFKEGALTDFLDTKMKELYTEKYNTLLQAYKESKITEASLDEIIADKNSRRLGNVNFRDQFNDFYRIFSDKWSDRGGIVKNNEEEINALMVNYLQSICPPELCIGILPEGGVEFERCGQDHVDLNKDDFTSGEFKNIYFGLNFHQFSNSGWNNQLDIPVTTPLGTQSVSVKLPDIYLHVEPNQAKETFEAALMRAIKKNFSMYEDIAEFYQNTEAMPITVNLNSLTGRCELIDGYKRILCTVNDDALDVTIPVRIFRDLTDKSFLALLYAANLWKDGKIFHDRGFLFALKTRFQFEIPKEIYQYKKIYGYKDTFGACFYSDLSIFQIYDFGSRNTYHDGDAIEYIKAQNLKVNHSKYKSINYKHHFVDDINFFYNNLQSIMAQVNSYDTNFRNFIAENIVYYVGICRSFDNSEEQSPLTKEIVESVFYHPTILKLLAKKHLTSDTYISNFFCDKHVFGVIFKAIVDSLCLQKENTLEQEAVQR